MHLKDGLVTEQFSVLSCCAYVSFIAFLKNQSFSAFEKAVGRWRKPNNCTRRKSIVQTFVFGTCKESHEKCYCMKSKHENVRQLAKLINNTKLHA